MTSQGTLAGSARSGAAPPSHDTSDLNPTAGCDVGVRGDPATRRPISGGMHNDELGRRDA